MWILCYLQSCWIYRGAQNAWLDSIFLWKGIKHSICHTAVCSTANGLCLGTQGFLYISHAIPTQTLENIKKLCILNYWVYCWQEIQLLFWVGGDRKWILFTFFTSDEWKTFSHDHFPHPSSLTHTCLMAGGKGEGHTALAPLLCTFKSQASGARSNPGRQPCARTVSDTGMALHGTDAELHKYNPPNPIEMDP